MLSKVTLIQLIWILGSVPLSKVKFDATQEWEFIANFKLLQKAFDKAGIKRVHNIKSLNW